MQFPNLFPRLLVFAALSCFGIGQVCAQKTMLSAPVSPQPDLFEASVGFNYIYLDQAYPETKNLYGVNASIFVNATSWLGVGGEFMYGFGTHSITIPFFSKADIDSQRYVYVFGPRITIWHNAQFRVFAEALAGGAQADAQISVQSPFSSITRSASDDSFATALGGGLDWRIANHLSWRILQADYLGTNFGNDWQDNFRASTGIVYSFGHR
jgi:opacity protein-like surface antigen